MTDDQKQNFPRVLARGNRYPSQIDFNLLQSKFFLKLIKKESKTIQSDQWEILNRVKQSLEGNVFNTFFANQLANLPNYKNPQELARALAEQFISKEIQKQQHALGDPLPYIKTPQLSAQKQQRQPRSKDRSFRSQRDQEDSDSDKKVEIMRKLSVIKEQEKSAQKYDKYKENNEIRERRYKERERERELREQQREKEMRQNDMKQIEMRKKLSEQQLRVPSHLQPVLKKPLKSLIQTVRFTPPPQPTEPITSNYTYYLGLGNNHELVKRVMDSRVDWHQTNHMNRANLKWQQSYHGFKYTKLNWSKNHKEILNHFEFHPEITNKKNLLFNLESLCEQKKLNLFDIVPVTFAIDFNDPQVEGSLNTFYKFFNKNAPEKLQISKEDEAAKIVEFRKKLRIPPSNVKRSLDFAMRDTFLGEDYLWLLKPTGLNRGRGIHVFNDINTLIDLLIEYQYGYTEKQMETTKDENGVSQTKIKQYLIKSPAFVVQKYIEKPLLIRNRKFDVRVWVMVNTDLACYFFKEGYIRTASEEFRTNDTENLFIHLTNNAIQKHSEKYGELDDGNQMSFDQVQDYFKSRTDFRKIVEKMKQLAYFSMGSVANKLNKLNRRFCFEIFGFDFILDDQFNVYLIEVNTNPCIEESSPLLQMLLPRMLDDAFALTVDQVFPTTRDRSPFPVKNYGDDENMWQLMGELQQDPEDE